MTGLGGQGRAGPQGADRGGDITPPTWPRCSACGTPCYDGMFAMADVVIGANNADGDAGDGQRGQQVRPPGCWSWPTRWSRPCRCEQEQPERSGWAAADPSVRRRGATKIDTSEALPLLRLLQRRPNRERTGSRWSAAGRCSSCRWAMRHDTESIRVKLRSLSRRGSHQRARWYALGREEHRQQCSLHARISGRTGPPTCPVVALALDQAAQQMATKARLARITPASTCSPAAQVGHHDRAQREHDHAIGRFT